VLGLSGAISICKDIVAHKLETVGEDDSFSNMMRMSSKAYTKLIFHVQEGSVEIFTLTSDVVNNDACVCLLIDGNP
jgi:hypothetical protein